MNAIKNILMYIVLEKLNPSFDSLFCSHSLVGLEKTLQKQWFTRDILKFVAIFKMPNALRIGVCKEHVYSHSIVAGGFPEIS